MDGSINHRDDPDVDFSVSVTKAEVTQSRPLATDVDREISHPALARANVAASRESPNGTTDYSHRYQHYVSLSPVDEQLAYKRLKDG